MLEKTPKILGEALQGLRAGEDKLLIAGLGAPETLAVACGSLDPGGRLPARCTQDGAGTSPALRASGVPDGATALLLVVEDADSPTPQPILHLAAVLSGAVLDAPEGAFDGEGDPPPTARLGRNSFGAAGWLAPDPPTGHGDHRYVVQLFALAAAPDLAAGFSKADVKRVLQTGVLAAGRTTALYGRG